MNKKSAILAILLLSICVFIISLTIHYHNKNVRQEELNLNKNEIQQIDISFIKKVNVTDKGQINKIVDYLSSLNTARTKLNPGDYSGMSYVLTFHFKNGTKRKLLLSGNKFFIETNKFNYEIPYKEAIKFDTIYASILENNEEKSGEHSITGTIISVDKASSGASISCVIEDKNSKTYYINIKNSKIIDSTGHGNLLLHEKDVITAFYEKDKQTDNTIVAATVFIKTAAPIK